MLRLSLDAMKLQRLYMGKNKVILKLINNGRYAIIETEQIDDKNPKPYLVRKVVEVRKDPIITVDGKVLKFDIPEPLKGPKPRTGSVFRAKPRAY